MPAVTHAAKTPTEVYAFILDQVLKLELEDHICLALDSYGVVDLTSQLMVDLEQLRKCVFPLPPKEEGDTSPGTTQLKPAQVDFVEKLIDYDRMVATGNIALWTQLDFDEWGDWCRANASETLKSLQQQLQTTAQTSNQSPPSTPSAALSLAEVFEKGNKRSPDNYPEFKEDRFYRTWRANLESQAYADKGDKLLDPTYTPQTHEEVSLFRSQQNFMYDALNKQLKTIEGRAALKTYQQTRDAQKVLEHLDAHYTQGAKSTLDANTAEEAWKGHVLGPNWKQPLVKFLSKWASLLLDHETVTSTVVSDKDQCTQLEKAI